VGMSLDAAPKQDPSTTAARGYSCLPARQHVSA
jgi:hypothetical protein